METCAFSFRHGCAIMKTQYLILCASCRFWTICYRRVPLGGGKTRIDTTCRICGARLLRKGYGGNELLEHPDPMRQYINAYSPGRGAHNRTRSVIAVQRWYGKDGGAEASRRNREILQRKMPDNIKID